MSEMRNLNEVSEWRPFFEIEAWMPSEIKAVGPLVQRLMRLIEGSHFVAGEEPAIELALEEALNNAVVHGNRMDREKLVQILCRCDAKGISLVVKDQGQGFDPNTVPNPLSPENLSADRERGIWLMRVAMDKVSFENRGTEVHMRKAQPRQPRTEPVTQCSALLAAVMESISLVERVNSSNKRG